MIYINDQIDQIDLEKTLSIIPSQRREQALRYKHELGRRLCVAAYMLLTEALRAEFGITEYPIFEYGPHDIHSGTSRHPFQPEPLPGGRCVCGGTTSRGHRYRIYWQIQRFIVALYDE